MSRLVTVPMPENSFHCYGSSLPTSAWDIISLNFISILQHVRGLDKHLMEADLFSEVAHSFPVMPILSFLAVCSAIFIEVKFAD